MKTIFLLFTFASLYLSASAQWETLHEASLPETNIFDIHVNGPNLVAVGYKVATDGSEFKSSILYSGDAGKTWTTQTIGNRFLKTVAFTSADTGYIGGFGLAGTSYIMRTTDGGATWSDHFIDHNKAGITNIQFFNAKHGLAIGYDNEQFSNGHVYETKDGGETWSSLTKSPVNTSMDKLQIIDDDVAYCLSSVYFNGSVLGSSLSKTSDGGKTWSIIYSHAANVSSMYFFDTNTGLLCDDAGGIYKSTDGGDTWEQTATAPRTIFGIMQVGTRIYGTGATGLFTISDDNGETWIHQRDISDEHVLGVYHIGAYAFVCGSNGLVARGEVSRLSIEATGVYDFDIYPNPVAPGQKMAISIGNWKSYQWIDLRGHILSSASTAGNEVFAPDVPGVYILEIQMKHQKVRKTILVN